MIWEEKRKDDTTVWDTIKDYGKDGWELVSVTPIEDGGGYISYTQYLLYTFKKPSE
jgi:hypothetical protein